MVLDVLYDDSFLIVEFKFLIINYSVTGRTWSMELTSSLAHSVSSFRRKRVNN